MISNDDPKAMIPPLLKAQAAGIKIVNIDGDLAEKSVGVTNIQSDNTARRPARRPGDGQAARTARAARS